MQFFLLNVLSLTLGGILFFECISIKELQLPKAKFPNSSRLEDKVIATRLSHPQKAKINQNDLKYLIVLSIDN